MPRQSILKLFGEPKEPKDLLHHRCIVLERLGQPMNEWHFEQNNEHFFVKVTPHMSCSDGSIIRRWVQDGHGIAFKSLVDIKHDVDTGKIRIVLDEFFRGFSRTSNQFADLQAVYPSRQYQPIHVKVFIDFFDGWLNNTAPLNSY